MCWYSNELYFPTFTKTSVSCFSKLYFFFSIRLRFNRDSGQIVKYLFDFWKTFVQVIYLNSFY